MSSPRRMAGCRRCAASPRSGASRWWSTRSRPGSGAPGRCGPSSMPGSCPMWSSCRRPSVAGCRWPPSSTGASSMPGRPARTWAPSGATSWPSWPARPPWRWCARGPAWRVPRRSATGCGPVSTSWPCATPRSARCAAAASCSGWSWCRPTPSPTPAVPVPPTPPWPEVRRACLDRGLIVELGGRDDTVVRMLPPLDDHRCRSGHRARAPGRRPGQRGRWPPRRVAGAQRRARRLRPRRWPGGPRPPGAAGRGGARGARGRRPPARRPGRCPRPGRGGRGGARRARR